MFNKRLLALLGESKKYIAKTVVFQWLALLSNITVIISVSFALDNILRKKIHVQTLIFVFGICFFCIVLRWIFTRQASKMSHYASKDIKGILRNSIYQKLLLLGGGYHEKISTSQVLMLAIEGVEQLDIYFSRYLPQLFYSLLAPISLFILLSFFSLPPAAALLGCVPLIPLSIIAVQKFARKLLSKYWNDYMTLGDNFLENLQGLTTLKIYQADDFKNKEMNAHAERFRKITMKVLSMQLNSVTLMDLIAYGGSALGIVLAVTELNAGRLDFFGCFIIILLSAEFFIPLRLLGSYFHIAMNGAASAEKIFALLDINTASRGIVDLPEKNIDIVFENVSFSYNEDRPILYNIDLTFSAGSFTSIVGESGCGKSTIAGILMGHNHALKGRVLIASILSDKISEQSRMRHITLVAHNAVLFKATVRDNLKIGNPHADDEAMWASLKDVRLDEFIQSQMGLDTLLTENGANFSGGQRQRLALARALLHDSQVYIFDEAASNVDIESETDIMALVHQLAKTKTIIFISHRLANVVNSTQIYMMAKGKIVEAGTHDELMDQDGAYARLYREQQKLISYGVKRTKHEAN